MAVNVSRALSKARSHLKKGEHAAAAALFEAVLEAFPGNAEAARGLAKLRKANSASAGNTPGFQQELRQLVDLFNRGHVQRALQQGQVLAGRYPDQPLVFNVLGAASKSLFDYDTAIDAFTRAIELLSEVRSSAASARWPDTS